MQQSLINIAYLVSAVLFIFCFKMLSHPRTAIRGNLLGAIGMLLAIVATLVDRHVVSYTVIAAGFAVGSIAGAVMALKIAMTAMPQMVALLNGFGGGASVLVAGAALIEANVTGEVSLQMTTATVASGIIGGVTFWGSLVAFAKLQEFVIKGNAIRIPMQNALNVILGPGCIALGVMVVRDPTDMMPYWILVGIASILGFTLTLPIGGADMPVVIALLNSYSGLAAASTGFVLSNNALIISGSLVGASGIILSEIMCRAMNRSLPNVLFGTFQGGDSGPSADDVYAGKVKSTSAEEIAMLFDTAQRVVVVPGYGMAVSQAQHAVRDLATLLEGKGVEVEYAIHPVAGRMPGHMNVLLAEANVDYDKLKEMDAINPTMETVDVCIVIGANDVVNPVARDPNSLIAGMPIIDVDKARTVVVIKRSLSPGFAGIPNPLFAADNTLMFFADGKKAITDLIGAVKESA
jgi:NAD(P) transhydrogenase subunit beta